MFRFEPNVILFRSFSKRSSLAPFWHTIRLSPLSEASRKRQRTVTFKARVKSSRNISSIYKLKQLLKGKTRPQDVFHWDATTLASSQRKGYKESMHA